MLTPLCFILYNFPVFAAYSMASGSDLIKVEGIVEEALPGLQFRVKVDGFSEEVLAHLGGKMKLHRIRVIPGDRVLLEMTSFDRTRGRIVRRL